MTDFPTYLQSKALSEATVAAYTSSMLHYFSMFPEVTTENVYLYRQRCLEIHKPMTVNLRLNAIRKYAKYKGIDVEIPLVRIQEPIFAENVLTDKEYEKILTFLANTGQTDWLVAIRLLSGTGLRISESYQVTVGDLRNCTRKEIVGKGTKSRTVWFPLKMRQDVLPLLKGRQNAEKIMLWPDNYIRVKLKTLQKKLRIKAKVSPHELRRYFARKVYAKTRDIYLVKDLLGHRNIQTTMRYLRVTVQSVSKRMSKLVDW